MEPWKTISTLKSFHKTRNGFIKMIFLQVAVMKSLCNNTHGKVWWIILEGSGFWVLKRQLFLKKIWNHYAFSRFFFQSLSFFSDFSALDLVLFFSRDFFNFQNFSSNERERFCQNNKSLYSVQYFDLLCALKYSECFHVFMLKSWQVEFFYHFSLHQTY